MTLPKRLQEKRDELAKRRSSFQSSSGCKLTDEVWRRHIEIGFEDGFDEACDILHPEIEKLLEALEMYTDIYTPNNDYANQALKSWQEFLGEKSEGE